VTQWLIKRLLILPILLAAINVGLVSAKDLGVHGRIYPIKERDLLEVLLSKAQSEIDSGQWDDRVKGWQKKAKKQAGRPKGVSIPPAKVTSARLHDPSVIVPSDIKDADGNLLYAAGTIVNPLRFISMTRQLIFIDGDNIKQVDWAMAITNHHPDSYKIILTNGPIMALMKRYDRRLYFDQHQQLTRKLNIQGLPAVVSQSDLHLRIDEIAL